MKYNTNVLVWHDLTSALDTVDHNTLNNTVDLQHTESVVLLFVHRTNICNAFTVIIVVESTSLIAKYRIQVNVHGKPMRVL